MKTRLKYLSFCVVILGSSLFFQCKKAADNPPKTDKIWLNPDLTYGLVLDAEGNEYATIKIGGQEWMAENLKVTQYNDGTPIRNITENAAWENAVDGAWSYYGNNAGNNTMYGKLYNWYAVGTGKLCPAGWHIPTDAEWGELIAHLGGTNVAAGKMKSILDAWSAPNIEAINTSGFSGVPGGNRHHTGEFQLLSERSYFWGGALSGTHASSFYLYHDEAHVGTGSFRKTRGMSCRCVQD